jgi:purine-binding chemotaxis protein CheW
MQLLLFRLGEQLYGLEVANLQEIVEAPAVFFIPMAPACFCGAMNFHGQILPVLDLPGYVGIEGGVRDRRVIVLAEHLCPLAFTVTALRRIVLHDPEALLPHQAEGEENRYSRFKLNGEGETVYLLDAAAVVASLDSHAQRRK